MISSDFSTAFSLHVFHDFFENNDCNCISYELGPNSKTLKKRFGVKMVPSNNGFTLLINSKTDISTFINYLKTVTSNHYFDFIATTDYSEFYAFTDFPIDFKGALLLDSQNSVKGENGEIELSIDYNSSIRDNSLFKLSIHFDDIVTYLKTYNKVDFLVKFNSRPTQWQYYIINRSNSAINNLEIVGKTNISFSKKDNVILQNGEKALLLYSNKDLQLSEVPNNKFDLTSTSSITIDTSLKSINKTKTIISGLPNPIPKKLSIETINNKKKVVSPMYIYV